MEHSTVIDAPIADVFEWHRRPGAIERLIPPWQPLHVLSEAQSLSSGTAVLGLPLGIRWSARHLPSEYRDGARFVDRLDTPILRNLVPWTHEHCFEPISDTSTLVTDRVITRVPDGVLAQNLAYRGRQLSGDLAAHRAAADAGGVPMTVAVTGSSGLIGSALCAFLSTGGHRVVRLVRSTPGSSSGSGIDQRHWDPDDPSPDLLDGVDAVVHLAGEPVAGRFDAAHKRAVRDSRIGPTRRLAEIMGGRTFVVASAVGIYGPDRGDEILTERSERGDGFLADVVSDWEAAADPARESHSRVTHVRTGIVQSPRGGVLRLLRPIFEIGAGGRIGDGRQWTPWIGIDDMVDIYLRCLVDQRLSGPVNAVAPTPVTNRDYTKVLAHVLRRPALVPVPSIGPRALFGAEAVHEFVAAGQRVDPASLAAVGHEFRHATLEPALRHLLGRVRLDVA
ncbi:MAG: TIGR01777 family protein [Microthrixaceae bacterium]|nr:TIGR01777 family protein [Microthrixaceae bacterium]